MAANGDATPSMDSVAAKRLIAERKAWRKCASTLSPPPLPPSPPEHDLETGHRLVVTLILISTCAASAGKTCALAETSRSAIMRDQRPGKTGAHHTRVPALPVRRLCSGASRVSGAHRPEAAELDAARLSMRTLVASFHRPPRVAQAAANPHGMRTHSRVR